MKLFIFKIIYYVAFKQGKKFKVMKRRIFIILSEIVKIYFLNLATFASVKIMQSYKFTNYFKKVFLRQILA